MRTLVRVLALAALCAAPCIGQEPPAATRGAKLEEGPANTATGPELKYRKKWSVVIGIDYRREDRAGAAGDVPRLNHAESDARAVHELLVDKFGFESESKPLLGAEATQSKIREEIGKLASEKQVMADDCVLVYFSGHGVLHRVIADNAQRGYLLPIDVKWTEDQPNLGSAINMGEVVSMLSDCSARHKLLVLDCCHSGAVFFRLDIGAPGGSFDHEQVGKDVFSSSAFQAITASRDNQRASDGRNGHSPFTNALLESLKTIPLRNERALGQRAFTTSQLFVTMKPYLDGEHSSPQCRWLTGDQGEFHFVPDPKAVFSEGIVDERDRNTLLALTPTTFGNWWAYEVPWFMPGLRLAILEQNAPTRSTVEELDRESLLIAARRAQQRARESGARLDPLFEMRYRHLDELLSVRELERQKETMRRMVAEMTGPKMASSLKAEDTHYLAVLHQLLGDAEQANKQYAEALKKYQDAPNSAGNPLEALCLLDAGMLSASREELELAKERIRAALKRFEGKAPKPFQVYALCREADVYRREGKFGMSRSRMEEAVNLLTRWDPNESTLLSANTMKMRAWAFMEGWDFKKAEPDFRAAQRMLENESHQARFESKIDRLHIRHGLAMIERYQGRTAESLAEYRLLTPQIAKVLRDLENRRDDDLPNYAEIRALLFSRLVNSLERQADCSLFGEDPDFAEAADDYRRALNEAKNLPDDQRDGQRVDLLYRRAAAVCLHLLKRECSDKTALCHSPEVELARQLCAEAEEVRKTSRQLAEMKELPRRTRLVQSLALTCVQIFAPSPDQDLAASPLKRLPELPRDSNAYDRDELERLMFFYKVLIDHRDRFGISAYESLQHVAQLLAFCRSACRLDSPDPELLGYLRPYYDSAFVAHNQLLPGHAKELIEIAWEATRGTPYMKPGVIRPVLVVYVANNRCYMLLDAPGLNRSYLIDEIEGQQLIAASATKELATLPDEVRKTLREIQRQQAPIVLRWRDPVLRIGYSPAPAAPAATVADSAPATSDGVISVVARKPILESELKPDDSNAFPFNLQGILKAGQFDEDTAGLSFKRTSTMPESIKSAGKTLTLAN